MNKYILAIDAYGHPKVLSVDDDVQCDINDDISEWIDEFEFHDQQMGVYEFYPSYSKCGGSTCNNYECPSGS